MDMETFRSGVPVNKVISARSHLRRPASDGRVDGKTDPRCRILREPLRPVRSPERWAAARALPE